MVKKRDLEDRVAQLEMMNNVLIAALVFISISNVVQWFVQ